MQINVLRVYFHKDRYNIFQVYKYLHRTSVQTLHKEASAYQELRPLPVSAEDLRNPTEVDQRKLPRRVEFSGCP